MSGIPIWDSMMLKIPSFRYSWGPHNGLLMQFSVKFWSPTHQIRHLIPAQMGKGTVLIISLNARQTSSFAVLYVQLLILSGIFTSWFLKKKSLVEVGTYKVLFLFHVWQFWTTYALSFVRVVCLWFHLPLCLKLWELLSFGIWCYVSWLMGTKV
jgi:hypothetical protein